MKNSISTRHQHRACRRHRPRASCHGSKSIISGQDGPRVPFADLDRTVLPGSPDAFGKFIAAEIEKWGGKVVKFAGIKRSEAWGPLRVRIGLPSGAAAAFFESSHARPDGAPLPGQLAAQLHRGRQADTDWRRATSIHPSRRYSYAQLWVMSSRSLDAAP
jgi:hypothetical protein